MVSHDQTGYFWPHYDSVIHNRKAVHLTNRKLWWEVNFLHPLKRHIFMTHPNRFAALIRFLVTRIYPEDLRPNSGPPKSTKSHFGVIFSSFRLLSLLVAHFCDTLPLIYISTFQTWIQFCFNCLPSLPLLLQCLLLTMVWENMLLVLSQWWLTLLHYLAATLAIYLTRSPSVHLWRLVGLSQGPCLLSSCCTRKGCLLFQLPSHPCQWISRISTSGYM